MKSFFKSFYGKLSAVFMLLLIIVGAVQIYLTYNASLRYLEEVDQKLNLHLAGNIAGELQPMVKDSLSVSAIKESIHYMMVMNPKVEIYLTGHDGKILAYFADPPQKLNQKYINLKPVQKFLNGNKKSLILGEDPRQPDKQKPFSAATLNIGSKGQGYVYIILGGEQYDTAMSMVKDSYILQTSLKILVIVLLLTGIIGLILFAFLTRRIRRMSTAVKAFENGEMKRRIHVTSDDEIDELAGSFNKMADTIVSDMDKLKKTDKLRRELVANVSHDLRSPLASIQGYLETIMLKGEHISKEERDKYLEIIFNNTSQLGKLISDLFELSKLDAREIKPRPEPFSIAELAQDVVMKLKPSAEKKKIDLRVEANGVIPMVYGDIGLIERALTNIIDNAVRYTPSSGRVTVQVKKADEKAEVEIEDTGPGVEEEELNHLFDRFYRLEKSRNRSDGGSGLGLAIAKKVLDIQQIALTVESKVGEGTRFRFLVNRWKSGNNEGYHLKGRML
jgi:signal transduction histidine kinase